MRQAILKSVGQVAQIVEQLRSDEAIFFIERAVGMITECYRKKRKLLIAGNGGSLCDAMHFAEEMTGFFRAKRRAFPAIALADPGHISCVGNDVGFESVFSRSLEALGEEGDIFIALTTSGNSQNLIQAAEVAKQKKLRTIAFLGKSGGVLKGLCDLEWIVKGFPFSDRVQEAHMTAIHIIIEMVEKELFHPEEEMIEVETSSNVS